MSVDTEHRDSHSLARFIEKHEIEAELIKLKVDTPTVKAAAEALDVDPGQIIKSLLFLADEEPLLVIACGHSRVDRKGLADYLGLSRRRVKIASPSQLLELTGYSPGGVPPFGHKHRLRTVVEAAVYSRDVVYGGGGDSRSLIRLKTAELQRVAGHERTVLTPATDKTSSEQG